MFIKVKVNSTAIDNVSYSPSLKTLRIEFNHGGEYDYPDVPEQEFHNLVAAPSVGKYFHSHIKQYSAQRRI